MVAVNLYLIELDVVASGLGEHVWQSSDVCESEEWDGLSDGADAQASAGHGFSGGRVNVEDPGQHSQSAQEEEGKGLSECERAQGDALQVAEHDDADHWSGPSVRETTEVQIESALSKIELWCDLRLSGQMAEEQWQIFEDCMGRWS
jgi:hypothetical protein